MNVEHEKESQTQKCPIGVFHAPAFVADFPPIVLEFHHRTHRVRLRNLGTTDKKSSHKIRYRKIPKEHNINIKVSLSRIACFIIKTRD